MWVRNTSKKGDGPVSAEPSSVSEHPEPLRSLHQLVELVPREDDLATAEPLFRGEPKVFDTALVPKVFRPESQKHFALTRVKGSGMYTGQGHVPPVVAAVQALEHFKRLGLPYVPREPADDWEWLAIAQHHGLATPLLDWSRNPLCALFFAVESSNGGQESVLWRLDHRGRAAKLLSVGLNAGKAHVSKKSADPFQLDAVHVFFNFFHLLRRGNPETCGHGDTGKLPCFFQLFRRSGRKSRPGSRYSGGCYKVNESFRIPENFSCSLFRRKRSNETYQNYSFLFERFPGFSAFLVWKVRDYYA